MRFSLIVLLNVCLNLPLFSQDDTSSELISVEDRISGIQTNLLELVFYEEQKLTRSIALRGEVGLNSELFSYSKTFLGESHLGFISALQVAVEPRWYYNLRKRDFKGKNTSFNNGSYISLRANFIPNMIILSNVDERFYQLYNQITFIPTFGMRHTWWNHFDFELGLGLGYHYSFYNDDSYHGIAFRPHLRLGYKF